jgi:anti-sigma B factor antagonist
MKVTTQKMEACELVVVEGMLDSVTAPSLEKTLQGLMAAGRNRFVVNLAGVEIMSSVGLRALLSTVLQVRRQTPRGDLVISSARPDTVDIFKRVGLMHVFSFYEDDARAAEALASGS